MDEKDLQLPPPTVALVAFLMGLQQRGLLDLLIVSSDSRIERPLTRSTSHSSSSLPSVVEFLFGFLLTAVSGLDVRISRENLDWLEPVALTTAVQKFLNCNEEAAQHVLDVIGGNLKELGKVQSSINESPASVLAAKRISFDPLTFWAAATNLCFV